MARPSIILHGLTGQSTSDIACDFLGLLVRGRSPSRGLFRPNATRRVSGRFREREWPFEDPSCHRLLKPPCPDEPQRFVLRLIVEATLSPFVPFARASLTGL